MHFFLLLGGIGAILILAGKRGTPTETPTETPTRRYLEQPGYPVSVPVPGKTLTNRYYVKAVGGMLSGKSNGPYTAKELLPLYEKYKGRIGGFWVKEVHVIREDGSLFFRFPKDGGPSEFLAKDARA